MIAIPSTSRTAELPLTQHAQKRMQTRNISIDDVERTIDYGRPFFTRDLVFLVIGRKEINRYRDELDLEHLNGLHVLCSRAGDIITVYRNPKFRTKQYPNEPRRRRRQNRRMRSS